MRPDNRSSLLAGARRCLDARGYARTTAREVAAESGVSLAAIGYHFGSTDALLVEALLAGMEEWSAGLDARLVGVRGGAARWDAVIGSLEGYRGVLAASYELIARADDATEVRDRLRVAVTGARSTIATRLGGDADGAAAYAVMSGLIVQWLVDPATVPTGRQLAAGLRELA